MKTNPLSPRLRSLLFPAAGLALAALTVAAARSASTATPVPSSAPLVRDTSRISAEGRVVAYPGSLVVVASDLGGTIDRLDVVEKATVKKGELLATLRADDHRAALAEAKAKVVEADADIRLFEAEVERARQLWQTKVGTKQDLERRERDLDSARARRSTAVATVARLEAVLAKTRITAPISGTVIERPANAGETIAVGAPILTIADLSHTRVEAEVDEFDSGRIAIGAEATVTAEGFDGPGWKGHVEEIPDTVVSRRLRPQDPGRPTDTRVLLVKVALSEPMPVKLLQRVEVSIKPSK